MPSGAFGQRQAALRRSCSEATLNRAVEPVSVGLKLPIVATQHVVSMRDASRERQQHLLLAFLAGALAAYIFLTIWLRMDHSPGAVGLEFGRELSLKKLHNAVGCSDRQHLHGMADAAPSSATLIPDKLIVAARHEDDTSWLDIYLSHIPHIVYQVDDPKNTVGAQHATFANKGNEAMAYLQFIIDYYDQLPASIVFLHGHRGTWHLKDHVPLLKRLRWGKLEFANLRYANSPGDRLDWECGNRTNITEFKSFDCNWQGSHLRPASMKPRKERELNVGNKDCWWDSVELREVWPEVYEAELGELPAELRAPCCAEFLVSRDRILAHPQSFYLHLRDWIIETELGRYRSGRIFEYMWHFIFGEPSVIDAVPECELLYCEHLS